MVRSAEQVVEDIYARGWQDGAALVPEYYAAEFLRDGVLTSVDEWQASVAGFYRSLDDVEHDLLDRVASGELVYNRYNLRAVHARDTVVGDFRVPGSGAAISLSGLEMRRVRGGKVIELWFSDMVTPFLAQVRGTS